MDKVSLVILIIALSALLQFAAALYAFKLIRQTGFRTAWILISGGLAFMAVRRCITLGQFLLGVDAPNPYDFVVECVALVSSLLMLGGVMAISPLFQTITAASQALKRSRDELEIKVSARTEELRTANVRLSTELEERRVAQRELARSNAELEEFAYVASHDLQEPLRMVASFTQLLARRYRGKLDADANEFIDFAVEGARRMQMLLNDLLAYSRVGTRGKPFAPTDLNTVLDQARANLTPAIEESQAVITQTALPTLAGDEVQLLQLFQNLIANALKFRGKEPPRIQVSAEHRDREWIFAVRDHGIGIAPEHQERIFLIFQRLHSRTEYPGTGIGLALCKKIVERHGGRIWAESNPDQGTTFYFSLPG